MFSTHLRSRFFRMRKHAAVSPRPLALVAASLTLSLLIPANLYVFRSAKFNISYRRLAPNLHYSPTPLDNVQYGAGGNPNYILTPHQEDVRNVTRTMYRAYMNACMGRDEFEPTTNNCHDWFNVGLTILDSLDTLILMGLRPEYEASREWAAQHLSFHNIDDKVSMFEIVIRALGGLNTAYQLTSDSLWLEKSVELADMLLESFALKQYLCPPPTVYIGRNIRKRTYSDYIEGTTAPAEAGTLQLEFRTLSNMTGDPKYASTVDRCQNQLLEAMPESGLVSPTFDLHEKEFFGTRMCVGGGVDSFYEMLVKNWITWGKKDTALRDTFVKSVESIYETLVRRKHGHTYVGELHNDEGSFRQTMDHLACFLPGTLAIGAMNGLGGGLHGTGEQDYMPRARDLTKSCYAMTRGTRYGLAGEITDFGLEIPKPKKGQDMSLLRPEIVEALYYMDKIDAHAGDKYKKMGQTMWRDMRRVAQVRNKQDGIMSSTFNLLGQGDGVYHEEKLHSFVIAETFKYFFLLFDERPPLEGPFPLDKWVYNTEAHPVKIIGSP